jgi:hypothetical protein
MKLKSLRELADEAQTELPTVAPDDSGPPVHPGAKGSGNPLLDEVDYPGAAGMDDPVDMDEVDGAVTVLADAVAGAMEEHGFPDWRATSYEALVDAVRDAIVKHATPKVER